MFRDLENEQSILEIGFSGQFLNLVIQPEMKAEQPHILFKNSNRSFFQTTAQQISS